METKRFIGNDMPRIYARIRSDFGPDAVIVRTRSLLRDGAEPLIEVLAAPPESEAELTLELQRSLIDGALGRVRGPERPATIGDLEDMVARRPTAPVPAPVAPLFAEPAPLPEWLEGFVGDAPVAPDPGFGGDAAEEPMFRARREDAAIEHVAPVRFEPRRFASVPDIPDEVAPANDWATRSRPSIITRHRQSQPPMQETFRRESQRASVGGELVAAGFSERAAQVVEAAMRPGVDAAHAFATVFAGREVRYPEESRTALISMQGPAGAGRTTALMRMALDCADSGRPAMLVAADGSHAGGRAQVHAYAEAIGMKVVDAFDPGEIVRAVRQVAKGTCLFVDAPAGAWQAPAIPGVSHYQYLALPAHWQPGVLAAAIEGIGLKTFAGAVLTFTDLATELSPVLSLLLESPLGMAFISSGRDIGTGIEVADALMLASGILTTGTRELANGRLVATA